MWKPLQNSNQLEVESRIKRSIYEGSFKHESIYEVEQIGNHYFMARIVCG